MQGDLHLGSVVLDRARNKPLRIVGRDNRLAGEHPNIDVDDAMAREWGVQPDDTVWQCVFLPTGDSDDAVSAPTKPYAYPAGRLTRYPCEAAVHDAQRLHTQIIVETFAAVLEGAVAVDVEDKTPEAIVQESMMRSGIDAALPVGELTGRAFELAEASIVEDGDVDE
jgi:hypothetical protein